MIKRLRSHLLPAFCIILISQCLHLGCTPPPDHSTASLKLINVPTSASVGSLSVTVDYDFTSDYGNQKMWLTIVNPQGTYEYEQYSPIQRYSGSYTFTHYFSQVGTYAVWAAAQKDGGEGMPYGDVRSDIYSILFLPTTLAALRTIELQMTGDDLWPNYLAQNFYGAQTRDATFTPAHISYNVISNIKGLSHTVDPNGDFIIFDGPQKLYRWAIMCAYGKDMLGVDPKAPIVCGIDDVDLGWIFNPLNGVTTGITLVADAQHTVPPVCALLYYRIDNYYSSDFDKARVKTQSGIHEVGHAIGISGDDPNIDPPHSGANLNECDMHHMLPPTTAPVFCDGHKNFIAIQTWFQ